MKTLVATYQTDFDFRYLNVLFLIIRDSVTTLCYNKLTCVRSENTQLYSYSFFCTRINSNTTLYVHLQRIWTWFVCCTFPNKKTLHHISRMSKFHKRRQKNDINEEDDDEKEIVTLQLLLWRQKQQQRQVPLRGHGDQGQLLDSREENDCNNNNYDDDDDASSFIKVKQPLQPRKRKTSCFRFHLNSFLFWLLLFTFLPFFNRFFTIPYFCHFNTSFSLTIKKI